MNTSKMIKGLVLVGVLSAGQQLHAGEQTVEQIGNYLVQTAEQAVAAAPVAAGISAACGAVGSFVSFLHRWDRTSDRLYSSVKDDNSASNETLSAIGSFLKALVGTESMTTTAFAGCAYALLAQNPNPQKFAAEYVYLLSCFASIGFIIAGISNSYRLVSSENSNKLQALKKALMVWPAAITSGALCLAAL